MDKLLLQQPEALSMSKQAISKQAIATTQVDNAQVLITHWQFAANAETGWHQHQYDYIVVPLNNGQLQLATQDSIETVELRAGESYFRPAGVKHNVINSNGFEFAFVEIELK